MVATEQTNPATPGPPLASRPPSVLKQAMNLPNLITLSRLALSLVVFGMIYWQVNALLTAGVFILTVATDFLDGYTARKYGLVTKIGRILDPFADKIIIGGALAFLVAVPDDKSGVNPWMVIAVLGREMFITSVRGFLEQEGIDFSATWSGKIKMVFQCVAATGSILSLYDPLAQLPGFLPLRDGLLWGMVAITLYSGLEYVWRAGRLINAMEK